MPRRDRTPTPAAPPPPEQSRSGLWGGAVLLMVALTASAVLTLHHFGGLTVPGCGAGGACDAAAASRLGRVPVLDWPTSFAGVASFAAVLTGWIASGGMPGRALRIAARVGGALSLVLLGALVQSGHLCPYCLIVHAANLAFVVVAERSPEPHRPPTRWHHWHVGLGVAAAVLVMAMLLIADSGTQRRAREHAEAGLKASTRQIVEATRTPPPDAAQPVGFTGRYRLGPERAAVRVVIFTDYQCPDCRNVERELDALTRAGLSLSVSPKMFPLNADCNPHAPGNLHANACWAARAAEAAGILGGNDGFWRMHRWLFERGGSFTDAEIRAALPGLGFEPGSFLPVMERPDVNARISADIEEGMKLGIFNTPMIFINGVELKGWNAPQAVTRAVQAAAAAAPPPATSEADAPPDAGSKFLADWRESPVVTIPPQATRHWLGPEQSPVTAVLIGDYREKFTAEADGLMRVFTRGPAPNIRYAFVHFPVDQTCNPVAQMTLHPEACRAAAAAEAASVVDGEQGFWNMHDWLMRHQGDALTDAALRGAASELGIDPDILLDAMAQPFVAERIASDAKFAESLQLRAVPMIFINGRHAARWKFEAENVLGRMIMQAADGR